jgi:hypothetical protein
MFRYFLLILFTASFLFAYPQSDKTQGKIIYKVRIDIETHQNVVNNQLKMKEIQQDFLKKDVNDTTFIINQSKQADKSSSKSNNIEEKEQIIYFKGGNIYYLFDVSMRKVFNDTIYSIGLKKEGKLFKIMLFNYATSVGNMAYVGSGTKLQRFKNTIKTEIYSSQTVKIHGYNCKKATVSRENKDSIEKVLVYYTEELSNVNLDFPTLNGLPLYIEYPNKKQVMEIKSISFEYISDKQFEIPDKYTIINKD